MTGWAPRRFWTHATATETPQGFAVMLDGRPVRTPAKAALVLPSMELAEAVAAEWQAVTAKVDPATMPLTRMANSALDKVAHQRTQIIPLIADYGGSDLLCYRAPAPPALAARQAAAWDPLLDWAADSLGARLATGPGITPVAQDPAALARLRDAVAALSDFRLVAFHDLVALSGSLVLALALTRGRLTEDQAWAASRIDEDWQISQWGADEEATAAESFRRAGFRDAWRFFGLCP